MIENVNQLPAVEALRKSEEKYRLLAENATDVVWTMDLVTQQFTYFSPSVHAMRGYTPAEAMALPLDKTLTPESYARAMADLKEAFEGESVPGANPDRARLLELEELCKDGSIISTEVRIKFLRDAHGAPIGLLGTTRDITARKQAERVLQKTQRMYDELVSNIPSGIYRFFMKASGEYGFEYVSDRWCELNGLKRDEVLNDIEVAFRHFHPEDLASFMARLESVRDSLQPLVWEGRIIVHDAIRWTRIESRPTPLGNGDTVWDGVQTDITERRQAEATLRESERRFRHMMENVQLVTLMLDDRGHVLFCNDYLLQLTGWQREEVLGRDYFDLFIPPDAAQNLRSVYQSLVQGTPTSHFINEIITRGGERRVMSWNNTGLNDIAGKIIGVASIAEDITERIRGEEARARLEAQLNLAQKMEALGTLAGGVAHDFNNILGAIIGNVELAVQDVGADHPAMESLNEIQNASHRAKALVQQILAFSRHEQQTHSTISLRSVAEEAVALLRATLPAGIALSAEIDADAPLVHADPTQIHQALINLCTNAWQALAGGAGSIEVRISRVMLDAAAAAADVGVRPGLYACLSVADTGTGMDAATLARIYEPFFTTKPVGQGTGLGLSVVHGIMKAHDGAVTATSQPGKGTTFFLYFPAETAPQPAPVPIVPVPRTAAHGQHILYLDDEEALVSLVTRMLQRLGYRVSGYTQSKVALEAVRADPAQFDLVVTDLNMPGASGLDVAREVSRLRPELPIVLASGYITDALRVQVAELGIQQLIFKPNTADELCEVVQRLVGA